MNEVMVSPDSEEQLTDREQQQFTATLSQLKEQGAALLIVGTVPDHLYATVCSELLGDDSTASRRRLFISTDSDLPSVSDRLADHRSQLSSETAKRLLWNSQARSAAAPTQATPKQIPSVHVTGDNLADLGIQISEEINEFDEIADGLAPAELRVCFDSLESLLSDYDQHSVFRFLHILIGRLRSVQAMSHFHLPVDRNAEVIEVFSELFDATVELRIADRQLQQRWYLHDADLTSEWLPLPIRSA